jgi:hypothetical protein
LTIQQIYRYHAFYGRHSIFKIPSLVPKHTAVQCLNESDMSFSIMQINKYESGWNIIHLLSVHKGDMNICSPEKVIFPEGNPRGKYDYFEGEQISYLPYARENKYTGITHSMGVILFSKFLPWYLSIQPYNA